MSIRGTFFLLENGRYRTKHECTVQSVLHEGRTVIPYSLGTRRGEVGHIVNKKKDSVVALIKESFRVFLQACQLCGRQSPIQLACNSAGSLAIFTTLLIT